MGNGLAIEIKQLSKVYRLYDRPSDRLKEALLPFHKRYSRDFYALRDINLSIGKGETVGFIGRNGAGKSTLLKIITGVLTPTSGTIDVHGRIASLLELGAGFNPEMTGVENIYMNGVVMGIERKQMEEKVEDIIAFADIGDFIHQPVKMYSSGMFARLAFAVNAFVEPDILIVDEALSVGDSFFQAKCIHKMKTLLDSGVTVLFVSHDWGAVKSLCKRGVLLDKGQIMLDDTAEATVEKFRVMQFEHRRGETEAVASFEGGGKVQDGGESMRSDWFGQNEAFQKTSEYQRFQNGKISFVNVLLLDERERVVEEVHYGQKLTLRMAIETAEDVGVFGTGYHIRNAEGIDLVYSDSNIEKGDGVIRDARAGSRYVIDWEFQTFLREGRYNIATVMSIPIDMEAREVECCDFVPCALQFTVSQNKCEMGGYVHWPNRVTAYRV